MKIRVESTSNYHDLPELHRYKYRFRRNGIAFVWCSGESPMANVYETDTYREHREHGYDPVEMFRERLKLDMKAYDEHGTIFNPGATILDLAKIAVSGKFKDGQPCHEVRLLVDGYEVGKPSHAAVIAKCIRFLEKRYRNQK